VEEEERREAGSEEETSGWGTRRGEQLRSPPRAGSERDRGLGVLILMVFFILFSKARPSLKRKSARLDPNRKGFDKVYTDREN
jgi:hypothetical protein